MTRSKKHIVLITPGFPSDEKDTRCIPALQIYCKALIKNENIKLSVLSLHYPFTTTTYKWNQIDVYPLGFMNRLITHFISNKKVERMIQSIHQNDPIDLLHSFWLGECALAGHRFSVKNSIDHMTTLMGQDAKKGNRFAKLLPIQEMTLVSVSKFQQELFYKNYQVQTNLIPWGIDLDLIPPTTKKTIDIIGIGSLIPLKNYAEFLAVISHLKSDLPNIQSVIIGEGKLRSKLEKQIHRLGLEKNVRLLGSLPYQETQEYLARSKVLLHPSHYESFGMVFAESMANKTSIVSRKVGIAEQGNCWSIGESIDDFYTGCVQMLDRQIVSFTDYPKIARTIEKYEQLYTRSR